MVATELDRLGRRLAGDAGGLGLLDQMHLPLERELVELWTLGGEGHQSAHEPTGGDQPAGRRLARRRLGGNRRRSRSDSGSWRRGDSGLRSRRLGDGHHRHRRHGGRRLVLEPHLELVGAGSELLDVDLDHRAREHPGGLHPGHARRQARRSGGWRSAWRQRQPEVDLPRLEPSLRLHLDIGLARQ